MTIDMTKLFGLPVTRVDGVAKVTGAARYASDEGALDPNCHCKVCVRYSRAYLRHLYASNEVLAQVLNTTHNLSFYLDTMRAVRHSIGLGKRVGFLSGGMPRQES